MASVFTKIIKGEIPAYKIYEDEKTYAFLDINPKTWGHTLVVPKKEVDKLYELEDEDYEALWRTVKKIALHYDKITGKRVILKVMGTDIPHAHVHVMLLNPEYKHGQELQLSAAEFEVAAQKLRLH